MSIALRMTFTVLNERDIGVGDGAAHGVGDGSMYGDGVEIATRESELRRAKRAREEPLKNVT